MKFYKVNVIITVYNSENNEPLIIYNQITMYSNYKTRIKMCNLCVVEFLLCPRYSPCLCLDHVLFIVSVLLWWKLLQDQGHPWCNFLQPLAAVLDQQTQWASLPGCWAQRPPAARAQGWTSAGKGILLTSIGAGFVNFLVVPRGQGSDSPILEFRRKKM